MTTARQNESADDSAHRRERDRQMTAAVRQNKSAMIISSAGKGESVFIPRIPLIPNDFPFEFKRIQFPIKVCFAMTINKSQGQSLKVAGINLESSCFSHGQLYVACSRVGTFVKLFIYAPQGRTKNVVYPQVLQ